MSINESVAFVTGANGGLGECFVRTLLARGAAKVYAAARRIDALNYDDPRVCVVELDVTNPAQIARAAALARDTTLLVNNAGLNRLEPALACSDMQAARAEMEVNYFGPLMMIRAFSPAMEAGSTIVNVLSILARVTLPSMATLCASKAAALRMAEGAHAELAPRGVRVISVLPGAIDTAMSRDFPPPKLAPADVVEAVLNALGGEASEIYVGDMAAQVAAGLATDRQATQRYLASAA
ncbi:NAD(P)-dependent dehydrogenase (short-subunit alcohol dehydrogenase family) [Paraburkholderia bannensis]|uniref:NAD(P)-dependent dehydrogenase (Short-subunit alcohol dehydrogenase family) n=1 Tax=Paraburkholderia bannensis TaxID=765414 RepID=A0A7W9TW51_9BURK|nr:MULTISPECIES: SDR family NAD(P)-dependent oxidoreductase [Paraburkholderia]MBB3257180.1 NAD(P)-dependent dehydrogenase (short-subunit alcohol dehydrogenase family) [Paraburkholderia sp. WP4_3_2]MBB6102424.1 NAD(P)-dependent dehydrogenase (short-subunit alcohol dehydrogenase family) [Paraburkholderia bannensis]